MKMLLPVVIFCVVATFPSPSRAEWPDFPFVYVEGEAEVDVAPDQATVRFSVAAFHKESEVALSTMQTQLERALEILAAAEIPEDRITGFNLEKHIERTRGEGYQDLGIIGYYVSRGFEVEVMDLSIFSPLIADLMELDNVTAVQADFDVDDRERIESDLVQQASRDARSQAENLASGMGVEIASVFAVSESELGSLEPTFALASPMYTANLMAISPETVFVPDTINIRKNVNVMFKLSTR